MKISRPDHIVQSFVAEALYFVIVTAMLLSSTESYSSSEVTGVCWGDKQPQSWSSIVNVPLALRLTAFLLMEKTFFVHRPQQNWNGGWAQIITQCAHKHNQRSLRAGLTEENKLFLIFFFFLLPNKGVVKYISGY